VTKERLNDVFNDVIVYVRENHASEIDKAYDYYWEEEDPEEFLSGMAVEIGFVNFEDWLVCDYRSDEGKGFIARYIEDRKPDKETASILGKMQDSLLSLYEVVSKDENGVLLKDLAIGKEITVQDERLSGLPEGELFSTRFIGTNGNLLMGRCVYPFGARRNEQVLLYLEKQFARYRKRKNPAGGMADFLKEEAYSFNNIWLACLSFRS